MLGTIAAVDPTGHEAQGVQAPKKIHFCSRDILSPRKHQYSGLAKSQATGKQLLAGDAVEAKKLADDLNKELSLDTIVQGYWLPVIRAAIKLHENKAGPETLEILKPAMQYELAQNEPSQFGMLYPIYLRGQAYYMAGKAKEAASEFQKIIDHRGVVLNFPLGALAQLQLARAKAISGNKDAARQTYSNFLALWKDADPSLPILKQAKAEYAKLN